MDILDLRNMLRITITFKKIRIWIDETEHNCACKMNCSLQVQQDIFIKK